MAKGLRASTKKSNRTKIRARVYAPVDEARTARLSEKLLELASQPRAGKTEMDIDPEKVSSKQQDAQQLEDMDVDDAGTAKRSSTSTRSSKKENRVYKRHRRARNEIVFPKKTFKKTKGGPGKSR